MLQYKSHHIRTNADTIKDHNGKYIIRLQLHVCNELIKLNGITFFKNKRDLPKVEVYF